MAYVPLATVNSGNDIVVAWGNQVKDNFAAGVPDIFTTKGDTAVASGVDAAGRLAVGSDFQVAHAKATATLGLEYSSGFFALVTAGAQSIPDNTFTKVTTFSASIDTYNLLDVANSRLTIPSGTPSRYYIVSAYGEFAAHVTAGKYRDIHIRKNGSAFVAQSVNQEVTGGLPTKIMCTSFPILLDATDYVEMWCIQQTTTSINISNIAFGLFMIR